MGYVRGIVEHGLSVADQKAPKATGMVQDLVERALQVPQLSKLSEKAKPLVDTLDSELSTRVDAGLELYSAKKQLVIEKAQEAQEEYSAKKQLVLDKAQEEYSAKKQLVLEKAQEAQEQKHVQFAFEQYAAKKQLVFDKAQVAQEQYVAKKQLVLDKAQEALEKAQEAQELYSAKKQLVLDKAQGAAEKVSAKKQLVIEKAQEAQEQYSAKKQLVIEKAQEEYSAKKQLVLKTATGAAQEAQAVWADGSVAQLTVVRVALARLEGTAAAPLAQRLVGLADLLLPKLRLAVPRTLSDLRAAAEAAAPLQAKLAEAKLRAQEAAGRAKNAEVFQKAAAAAAAAQVQTQAACQKAKTQATALAAEAQQRAGQTLLDLAATKARLQLAAAALVRQHQGQVGELFVGVFGERAVRAVSQKAVPLLPAGVQDWIAQVDGLD